MTRKISLTDHEETLRQLLLDVSKYIETEGGCIRPQLRFTGGWVRDKLLGIESKDIDIGIDSMTGYEFGTLMKQYLDDPARRAQYGEVAVGKLAQIVANPEKSKHLETVTTKVLGLDIDLVNLRKETYDEGSRNPTMEFGTPEEDALRRDSTVNALFYNLETSEVEDLTERGLEDMELKMIRTPLSPHQTFKDDPLRILRCIRFASKLGYIIEQEAEKSMSDECIKHALRAKISRERVGIEIEKMLKGPQPKYALSLIDRLGLYNTVFTDPGQERTLVVDTTHWAKAYNELCAVEGAETGDCLSPPALQTIKHFLISNTHETYLSWLLCALTPWAKVENPEKQKKGAKKNPPMLAVIAREGLKTENKALNVIKDAAIYYNEIIASKDALFEVASSVMVPMKRKQETLSREALGMAIRRWGGNWRSATLLAMLVEIMGTEESVGMRLPLLLVELIFDTTSGRQQIEEQYAGWLAHVKSLDLMNAYTFKPVVDGAQLMQAFDRPSGKWIVSALNIVMEWQLRNPGKTAIKEAIGEVKMRWKELGLD
ncbi:CCA tRNA nucleotidyltransferase, mitochondrial [Xylographa opegraphella]|nr:CCA tRNA nucleotidyltransferase, mitochondrial [Xylographa opegraphella]